MVFSIKQIERFDLDNIVNIHLAALPSGFLSRLGKDAVSKYYSVTSSDKYCDSFRLIGILNPSGSLIGFCQLSFIPVSFFRILGFSVIIKLIHIFFFHPKLFVNSLTQFMFLSYSNSSAAEIAYIAISPQNQGNGAGTYLLSSVSQICLNHYKQFIFTKTSNIRLGNFYQSQFNAHKIRSKRSLFEVSQIFLWPANRSMNPCSKV